MKQSGRNPTYSVSSNTPEPVQALHYRPEIDGLRAVAVLAVILFHTGVTKLSGGFIGVDIFFVISGFLITKIILAALQEQRFSYSEFYARRVKRLLPAAFVMLTSTMIFGYFILTPSSYEELAKSAVYTSVFLANVWFANNSGYFDQAAEVSPLVHMWSLAVEEQFYLLFPVFLVILYRFRGVQAIRLGIVGVLIVSLVLSILLSNQYPDFSFYLLPTRAWELSAGALLVFLPWDRIHHPRVANTLFLAGSAMVTYGLFFISNNDLYPGYLALFPVAGAACLIISGHTDGSIGKHFLSARPMVLVGRISYSAYLWHWPIVSYYRVYVSERDFAPHEVVILFVLSVAAGYLSWKFIEERFRYRRIPALRTLVYGAIAAGGMLILPMSTYLLNGLPGRISAYAESITDAQKMWEWGCTDSIRPFAELDREFCVVGSEWNSAAVKGLIWGDSHSLHWGPVFHQVASQRNIALVIAPLECPPYLDSEVVQEFYPGFPTFTEDCTVKNRLTIDWLNNNPDVRIIVMAPAWSGHVRQLYTSQAPFNNAPQLSMAEKSSEIGKGLSRMALSHTIERLTMSGRQILLLGDIPRPNRLLNECAFNDLDLLLRAPCNQPYDYLDATEIRAWHADSNQVLTEIASSSESITAILPTEIMCSDLQCPTYLEGELIYRDSNHLRRNLQPGTLKAIGTVIGLPAFIDSLRPLH